MARGALFLATDSGRIEDRGLGDSGFPGPGPIPPLKNGENRGIGNLNPISRVTSINCSALALGTLNIMILVTEYSAANSTSIMLCQWQAACGSGLFGEES